MYAFTEAYAIKRKSLISEYSAKMLDTIHELEGSGATKKEIRSRLNDIAYEYRRWVDALDLETIMQMFQSLETPTETLEKKARH